MPAINPAHQLVILTRLSEFCQYHQTAHGSRENPWEFMRRKLADTEEPLLNLKKELLAATNRKLLSDMKAGNMDEERYIDFKVLYERLLSPGDFADIAIHLTTEVPHPGAALSLVTQLTSQFKPYTLFEEERKPPEKRSPAGEKLISDIHKRLELEIISVLLKRKPRTPKRKAFILRRIRRNVADYCAVLHVPTDPSDTFTPFMLPRVEAVIVASLRFLSRYR